MYYYIFHRLNTRDTTGHTYNPYNCKEPNTIKYCSLTVHIHVLSAILYGVLLMSLWLFST